MPFMGTVPIILDPTATQVKEALQMAQEWDIWESELEGKHIIVL